jgi:hypothetical protein
MTARNDDRLLSAWLHETAPTREPEHLLGQVLARTARTRRRPAWRTHERFDLMSAISSRFAPASPVPWRLIAVAAALLLALAVGLVLVTGSKLRSPAPPYGLAANGGIVYASHGEILVADGPGMTPRVLISGGTEDRSPIMSLDGARLVFLRGSQSATELWVANADGSAAHKVGGPWPDAPGRMDWSPGGDLIALTSTGPDDGTITLVRTDGSGSSTIVTGLAGVDFAAFRPPSGGQISFRATDTAGDVGFYLVNRDGTGQIRVAFDPGFQEDPYYDENRQFYMNDLAWDSTGTHAAFHTLEPAPDSPAGPGFRIHLADVDAAGTVRNERILEFDPGADDEFSAIFIPGTQDIVFRSLEGSRHRLLRGSTVANGAATELGVQALDWISAALSPDGKELIAVAPDGPSGPTKPMFLVDLTSLEKTPLSLTDDFSWQRKAP